VQVALVMRVIQAPDVQPNGRADMCDSCPDMTVWNGTLTNSCRMDEYRLVGGPVSVAKRQRRLSGSYRPRRKGAYDNL